MSRQTGKSASDSNKMYRRDLLFVAGLAVVLTVVWFVGTRVFADAGNTVRIEYDGSVIGEYPLYNDAVIPLPDENRAHNILTISDGTAFMTEADCPDKLCIRQGAIQNVGQTIVCLPNRIVVTVTGAGEAEYDTVAK